MTLKLITATATEPMTLAEARRWCRVDPDHTDDDDDLQMLIMSARVQAEHLTGRSFLSTTWELVLDAFPAVEMALAAHPVESIVSVRYLDPQGQQQTVDPADYVLDDAGETAFILPAAGKAWPATHDGINAVRVQFVQGWASASNPACAPLRQWLRMQVEAGFKLRGAISAGVQTFAVPGRYVDALLDSYRVWGV